MANAFKNRTLQLVGTTPVDVGADVDPNTETTLIGMTLANVTSGVINVTVQLINTNSSTGATTHIVKDAPIPTGGSLVVVGGDQKIVLTEEDKITVTSNTASTVDVIMSFLEIT